MTLKLGTKEYELAPITKNEWEYFHKTINEFAAKTYNPYPDFYQKIAFLPKEDRQAAVQGMINRTNWEIPNEYIQQILSHVDTVKHIFLLITHAPFEDHELITENNKIEVFNQLWPYMKEKREIVDFAEIVAKSKKDTNGEKS